MTTVLPRASGRRFLELAAQVVRDGDHRRRAADDAARERGDAGDRADVAHVAAVRGDDERRVDLAANSPDGTRKCAQTTSGVARRAHAAAQLEKPPLAAAAAIEHRELDLVPACAERVAPAGRRTTPRSGSAGPGYICETRRILTPLTVGSGRPASSCVPHSSRSTPQISPIVQRARSASRIGGSRFAVPRAASATRASAASASVALRSGAHPARALDTDAARPPGSIAWSSIGSSRLERERVDADDHALAALDLLRPPKRGAFDLALHEAALDRRHRAAELVDPLDQVPGARLELVGERLDVVRAAERVGRVASCRPRAARICCVRSAIVAACSRR